MLIVAVSGRVESAGEDYLRIHADVVWIAGEDDAAESDPPQELTLPSASIASAQLLEEPGDEEEGDEDEEEDDEGD